MAEKIIETYELTKKYGDVTAVDRLNMTVNEGEIFGFLGPNGAGKTTTILMLMGLSIPTSGTAKVVGYDIVEDSKDVRTIASILPEYSSLYGDLTAWQNLDYIGRLNDLSKADRDDRIAELLEVVSMTKWKDYKLGGFSRGMKQRIGIASTLVKRPKLVFYDEPTLGLDPVGTKEIRELILKLNEEQGLTVVMTSHLLHEVQLTCSRVGIINKGRLLITESIENLTNGMAIQGERSIEFKLSEMPKDMLRELDTLEGVSSVSHENDRLWVVAEKGSDMEISKTVVKHGPVILLMKPREYTLEEIFMKYYKEE